MNVSVFIVFLSFIFFFTLPAQPAFPRLPPHQAPSPPSGPTIATSTYLEGEVCSRCFAEGQNSQSPDCRSCYSPGAQCVSLWPGVDIKGDRYETYTLYTKSDPSRAKPAEKDPNPKPMAASWAPCLCQGPCLLSPSGGQEGRPVRQEAEGTGSVHGTPQSRFK